MSFKNITFYILSHDLNEEIFPKYIVVTCFSPNRERMRK